MTATETVQTLQERAKAAVAASREQYERYAEEQRQRNIKNRREGLVHVLMWHLGIKIPSERVAFVLLSEHDEEKVASVEIDGLIFAYAERECGHYSPHLVLLRRCEKRDDCGLDVASVRINNLDDLGRILAETPEHTECQVEFEERERRSESRAVASPPPPTVGERLLDALRDYVTSEVPEF